MHRQVAPPRLSTHTVGCSVESDDDFPYNSKCYAISRNETYTAKHIHPARAKPLYRHTIVWDGPNETYFLYIATQYLQFTSWKEDSLIA